MTTAVGVLVTSPVEDQDIVPVKPVISRSWKAAMSISQASSAEVSAVMPAFSQAAASA